MNPVTLLYIELILLPVILGLGFAIGYLAMVV